MTIHTDLRASLHTETPRATMRLAEELVREAQPRDLREHPASSGYCRPAARRLRRKRGRMLNDEYLGYG